MTRILITGCSGFLASYLIPELKTDRPVQLFGLSEVDDFSHKDMTVSQVDIRDRDALCSLVESVKPDLTFHFAAVTNVVKSWQRPDLTYAVNIIGTSNLLESIHAVSPGSRVVMMSSSEVFATFLPGEKKSGELPPVKNPYALSKVGMEMVADLFSRRDLLDIIRVRSFNFTGPGQSDDFVASDFAHQIARIERGEMEATIKVGNLAAVRDFSDVRDITRYLKVIAASGRSGILYNLCSGRRISIREILDLLLSYARVPINVAVDANKFRPLDPPLKAGDCKQLQQEFDLLPSIRLEETLQDLLEYWRQRLDHGSRR